MGSFFNYVEKLRQVGSWYRKCQQHTEFFLICTHKIPSQMSIGGRQVLNNGQDLVDVVDERPQMHFCIFPINQIGGDNLCSIQGNSSITGKVVILYKKTCHVTSTGSSIDQSATSIQILSKQSRSEFLMTSHVRSALWTLLFSNFPQKMFVPM